jgi:glycosyltransferase involved in cell wall biosynthesis
MVWSWLDNRSKLAYDSLSNQSVIIVAMKIGIDASRYKIQEPTGVEWYSYHILNNLIPILGRDHELDVTLYTQKELQFDEELPFNVKQKVIAQPRFWTLLRLSLEMLLHPVDLLFVPSHILPLWLPKKTVVTVHDIAFKVPGFEKAYDRKNMFLLNWSTSRAVRKAYKIIVPSHATKRDLENIYGCDPKKIEVIYHGGPELTGENNPLLKKWQPEEKQQGSGDAVCRACGIQKKYCAAGGGFRTRTFGIS